MIAWAMGAARWACGDAPSCVRLVPLIACPISALLMFTLAWRISHKPALALLAALAFASLPFTSFYGIAATTDGLLLMYWMAAMLSLHLGLSGQRWAWLAAGGFAGLALLSKYSAGVFALSALLALLHPQWRHWLRSPWPWLAALVAGLVFMPNLLWNLQHGMPTLSHTADISRQAGYSFHLLSMLEFVAAQFGLAGPVLFGGFLVWLGKARWRASADQWFLLALGLPFLALIMLQALLSAANANWAAPALAAVSLAAVLWLAEQGRLGRFFLVLSFALNGSLAVALYHFESLVSTPLDWPRSTRTDPFWVVRDWPVLAEQVAATAKLQAVNELAIASDDRALLAEMQALLHLPAGAAMGWQRGPQPHNHFELNFPLPAVLPQRVLLITQAPSADVLAAYPNAVSAGKARSSVVVDRPVRFGLWWLLP